MTGCSVTCGGDGVEIETRSCSNPTPGPDGAACVDSGDGTSRNGGTCNDGECPIDFTWGLWGDYGSCTGTCNNGDGFEPRQAACIPPMHGGEECPASVLVDVTRTCVTTRACSSKVITISIQGWEPYYVSRLFCRC